MRRMSVVRSASRAGVSFCLVRICATKLSTAVRHHLASVLLARGTVGHTTGLKAQWLVLAVLADCPLVVPASAGFAGPTLPRTNNKAIATFSVVASFWWCRAI